MQRMQPTRSGAFLASLGAGLEYYDFVAYALLAPYLRQAFFPSTSANLSTLEALSLFAVGYVARPLGGFVFGSMGDRHGRKNTFLITTLLMAAATFAMGCLPTHAQVGAWAPAALIVLRCLQGFSFGGELPGAITFVSEQSDERSRGRGCATVMSGVTSGSVVASFILEALSGKLGDEAMLAWGWRVPFWLGGTLAAVTWLARLRMHETPKFDATPRSALTPLRDVLRDHPVAVARGLGIALLGASLVMLPLYAPVYLQASFGIVPADTYSATTVSLVWATVVTLFAGRVADSVGPRRMLTGVALLWALFVPGVFMLLQRGQVNHVYAFCIAWQTATGAVVGSYLAVLSSFFPASVRQTGVALCYNTAFMLAALLPSVFAALVQRTGDPWVVRWVYVGVALSAVFAAFNSRKIRAHAFQRIDLPGS